MSQRWPPDEQVQQAAEQAAVFAAGITEAGDLQRIQVPEFKPIQARFTYYQWKQKLQMLTECDVRGAAWPRSAEHRTLALPQAELDVNAAAPATDKLWTQLQQWAKEREEQLSGRRYSTLSDAEVNAWVEWLAELQEKVRDARMVEGTDKERIRRAAKLIVSCCLTNR